MDPNNQTVTTPQTPPSTGNTSFSNPVTPPPPVDPTTITPTEPSVNPITPPTPSPLPTTDQPSATTTIPQNTDTPPTDQPVSIGEQPLPVPEVTSPTDTTPTATDPLTTTDSPPDLATAPAVDTPQPNSITELAQSDIPTTDTSENESYIENVGGSLFDLLDDINNEENMQQIVAKEMGIDATQVKTTLAGLIKKIDEGQITLEELALVMAAPVVDEQTENEETTDNTVTSQSSTGEATPANQPLVQN